MTDDITGNDQVCSEISRIIEDAISKIHDLRLVIDPRNGRRDVAAFIRWYIDAKYFHLDPTDQSKWPKGTAVEDIAKNGGQLAVEAVEAILRGDIDPVKLRNASEATKRAFGISSVGKSAHDKRLDRRMVAILYNEYCVKAGISKAEFVRRIIKLNQITVPRNQRRGINSTNFKNVYRELGRLLEKERIETATD